MIMEFEYFYCLEDACKTGKIAWVEYFIDKGANNIDFITVIFVVCEIGHMDILELIISKGANNWDGGLKGACLGGNMDIIELMINKGANLNFGLQGACQGGHKDLMELMISKGANNWNWGLRGHVKEDIWILLD